MGNDYEQFDNEASLREAKSRLPLDRLMEQHGDPPPPVGMKWGPCPFCKKKSTARITNEGSQMFFKCANDTCISETASEGKAWTELHYLKFKTGLSPKEVFIAYLKEAGVWREKERYKSLDEPKSPTASQEDSGQSTSPPQGPVPSGEQPAESSAGSNPADAANEVDDEDVIQKCIELILNEQRASVSLLQRRLRLGYTRATRIMAELEKRGIVGPSKGAEPRDILLKKTESEKSEATKIDEEIAKFIDYLKRVPIVKFNFMHLEGNVGFARAKVLWPVMQARQLIIQIGDEFELVRPPAPPVLFISDRPMNSGPPALIDGEEGNAALHDFFSLLSLLPEDEKLLFLRRGCKSTTSQALMFRSNPRANRGRLLDMAKRIAKQELLDSGLFMRMKDKKGQIKPNSQFCGAGIKRKAKLGEKPERNEWMDKDGNIWGWCEPILIPYFDEMGRIIGLRPHKGGGLANTVTGSPRVYIPRVPRQDGKQISEIFPRVIITEGEFKAAALYQTVGALRIDGAEPYGVVAVPGIWFGQSYTIREELDQWLRDVRCRVVKVAYDNEDKSNPDLASFKTDRRKRFDAEICARVLASDIANKLHIRGEVCRLPDSWRNEKGKADWDGALVKITQTKE